MPSSVVPLKRLSRNLVRSFVLLLSVLLGLLAFALWNFHRLSQADSWKAHTYQVLLESQRAKEALFLMDNGVRGYIVSGKTSDLRSFENGQRAFALHTQELQRLVQDKPQQEARLDGAIKRKDFLQKQLLAPIIAQRRPSDPLEAALRVSIRTAVARRQGVERVRSVLDEVENVEKGLLQDRTEAQERSRMLTEATLWAGSAFSVLLTLFLSSVALKSVRESAKSYARLRDTNVELEQAKSGLELEVAQRRDAEDKLQRAVAELKRSNAELEQFAYVASHDLQEPLRAVAGCVQVLKRRYESKLDERADQFIEHAVEGAQRMQNLIHDLLAYSRVGTKGKVFAPVSLDHVVDGALLNLNTAVKETGARIERAPLPTIQGDAGQLEQVFQNLLSNAIKFRGEDAPQISIGCESQSRTEEDGQERDGFEISVRDRGPGIEAQYFERIFVMFQRLHTRTEYPGTGIGLAIVKKIIERHGGTISVESEVGQGTTFRVWLPQNAGDENDVGGDEAREAMVARELAGVG